MFKSLLFVILASASVLHANARLGPVLQSQISWVPVNPHPVLQAHQPGSEMILSVEVRNVGTAASAAGQVYVEFSFKKSLEEQPNNVIFQTETKRLDSIEPGQSVRLSFERHHRWPSLEDYVRQDWAWRRYKAVVTIRSVRAVTGLASIGYEARYVDGIHQQQAQQVPEQQSTRSKSRPPDMPRRRFPYH